MKLDWKSHGRATGLPTRRKEADPACRQAGGGKN